MSDVQPYIVDYDRLKAIFQEFGIQGNLSTSMMQERSQFEGIRTHSSQDLATKVKSFTNDRILPETFFSFFLKLQGDDFDAGYLYAPGYTSYVVLSNPTTENIDALPLAITEHIPIPVVRIYEGEDFCISRTTIFTGGKVQYQTNPVGKHEYDPYFFDKQLFNRLEENHGGFGEMFQKTLSLTTRIGKKRL